MIHALIQTAVLKQFDGAPLARLRFSDPDLAIDAVDPNRVDYVDPDGAEWTRIGTFADSGFKRLRARHAARLGAMLVHREALLAVLEALPADQQTAYAYPTMAASPQRIEIGLTQDLDPIVQRNDGADGTPFEERTDLEAVVAEQGDQDVLIVLEAIPDDWTRSGS